MQGGEGAGGGALGEIEVGGDLPGCGAARAYAGEVAQDAAAAVGQCHGGHRCRWKRGRRLGCGSHAWSVARVITRHVWQRRVNGPPVAASAFQVMARTAATTAESTWTVRTRSVEVSAVTVEPVS